MPPVVANDPIAVSSAGILRTDKPAAPVLSVAAGTLSAVATITGDNNCTHYLYYRKSTDTSWSDGGSRIGDGTITITGLVNNVAYVFVAISKNAPGIFSLPSIAIILTLSGAAAAATANVFDGLLADTADDFLAAFGIDAMVLPPSGGTRAIKAIVDCEPPAEIEGMSGVHSTRTTMVVANNSTTGISSSEIDIGANWKVQIETRVGEVQKTKRITRIIYQDRGMMKLEVR
ncbi:MAG: hypothetical protein ABSG99_02705 [Sedimentisphaerales bacterium]